MLSHPKSLLLKSLSLNWTCLTGLIEMGTSLIWSRTLLLSPSSISFLGADFGAGGCVGVDAVVVDEGHKGEMPRVPRRSRSIYFKMAGTAPFQNSKNFQLYLFSSNNSDTSSLDEIKKNKKNKTTFFSEGQWVVYFDQLSGDFEG